MMLSTSSILLLKTLHEPLGNEGFTRPFVSKKQLEKRLALQLKAKNTYEQQILDMNNSSEHAALLERIKKKRDALTAACYEIRTITDELIYLKKQTPDEKDENETSPALMRPYLLSLQLIEQASQIFVALKRTRKFHSKSNAVLDQAIRLLAKLKEFRTFNEYDVIVTGAVVLVMMIEDYKDGPRHDKWGLQSFLYPTAYEPKIHTDILAVGKKVLLEKSLPFDGDISCDIFKSLAPVFPTYLAQRYRLDAIPEDKSAAARTKAYNKIKEEVKLLNYFKADYRRAYNTALFKNPFSKMKKMMEQKDLTLDEIREYIQKNPDSRSARIMTTIMLQGKQRKMIKRFINMYNADYYQTFFRNPFSHMKRNLYFIHSTHEIIAHAEKYNTTRTAHALAEILKTGVTRNEFKGRK
jgi:hypothetical protein